MANRLRQGAIYAAATSILFVIPTVHGAVIYQDNFGGVAGSTLSGGTTLVATGLDGGTAGTTWATPATPVVSGLTDAVWNYSGSSSVSILSPSGTGARDTNLVSNAFLPFTPQAGFIYDLEATITVPSGGTDNGHWTGISLIGTPSQTSALSNDAATGLVIIRDAVNGSSMNIFQGPAGGTAGQTNYNIPGGVGTPVTIDLYLNTLAGLSSETIDWSINGVSVGAPVSLAGNPVINDVAFGDDNAPASTVSNFSLTAVPEPASASLLLLAGGLALNRRHRRSAK